MENKAAVVTGSTSDIGLGIAHHLAAKGCHIVLTGLRVQGIIDNLVKEFKKQYATIKVNYVPCDLLKPEEISEFCKAVKNLYPDGIDILVNNAGIQYTAPIEDYP
ncbi:D-beta-hydroxybutyrate dehydrogenase-like [Mytilus californianus]|uniref:D-beta-hydroxybutyrate dehydrogenase-like n=1 Tax=Mytilus californianus TaxID=6549 RepID=UPI002246D468|nr:D-beta-hydroxybutyrate dehydrogenase-like [Mytilus californianus]